MSRRLRQASNVKPKVLLQHDKEGYPLLPLPRQLHARLIEKKELIRVFMTDTYRKIDIYNYATNRLAKFY
jgi:hypothetical protein